ncbi:MAG: hypothetical protein EXR79_10580 [Myxococcales bacterium]|nr:hypothetical protein [Myxococcales bacterium]
MAKKTRKDSTANPVTSAGTAAGPGAAATAGPKRVQPVAPPAALPAGGVTAGLDWSIAVGLGILAIVLMRVVQPGIRDLFQLPKQLYMAEGAALLLALVAGLAWLRVPLHLPRTPLLWPVVVFAGAVTLGVAIAPDETGGILSIFARYDAHRWAAAGVLFFVTLLALRQPRRLWPVLGGLIVGGFWVSLIGIGEHHDIRRLLPAEHWNVISKPGSTFGNRNMAAEAIVAAVPACYAVLAQCMRWYTEHRTALAAIVAGPTGFALLINLYYLKLTVTRSAWIGLVLGVMVAVTAFLTGRVLAERRRERRQAEDEARADELQSADPNAVDSRPPRRSKLAPLLVALAVAGVLVAGTSYVLVRTGFNTPIDEGDSKRGASTSELLTSTFDTNQNAAQWRFGMWESTWEAMKANPFGRGAGNWRVLYPQFVTQREKNEMFTIGKQPIRAHQDFLQMGSEFGFQGLGALLVLIGMAVWMTVRASAAAADAGQRDPGGAALLAYGAAASLAGIFGICGDALFSFPLQLPVPTFLFALHLGVIGAAEAWLVGRPGVGDDKSKPPALRAGPLPAGVAWGLTGLAAFGLAFLYGFGSWPGLHPRWMVAEYGFTSGRSLQKQGRASDGLVEIRRAIEMNPDDFQNHFIEGLNLNSLGQSKAAIASIEASLRLYPNLLNAWVNLAMFNARIGNDKAMHVAIDAALKLKPDELVALNVRADALVEQEKFDAAWKVLAPHVAPPPGGKLDPAKPAHKMSYVEYRMAGGFPPDDNQMLTQYVRTLKAAIRIARELKKWQEAAGMLEALIREPLPNDGRPEPRKRFEWMDRHTDLAEALANLGRWQDALPHFKVAAELAQAERGAPKRRYAVALARTGDVDGASHEAANAVRIDSTEKAALSDALVKVKADYPDRAAAIDQILARVGAM